MPIKKTTLVKSGMAMTGLTMLLSCQQKTIRKPQKPNIIFLFADDQRYGTIHYMGNDEIITPNLDTLAKNGTAFTNAYIMGGNSGAVCMPSRAMLHTGRNLFSIQDEGQEVPHNHALMGEVLQLNGYNCYGTGKWHNGKKAFARSFNAGDEIFFGGMGDHWNVKAFRYDSTGEYKPAIPFIDEPYKSNDVDTMDCGHITHGKHSTELFADGAVNYINNYNENKPLFMYVSFMAPHDPRSMPQQYRDMYDTADITIPPNFLPGHPFDNGEMEIRDEKLAVFPRNRQEVKIHIRDYYAMITHIDHHVGSIIHALKKAGMYKNSIIIYSGDNGLALGQHGLMGKQNVYEHSIKVPLIFSGKGIPADTKKDACCYLYDLFPTICDIINTTVPESVMGKSIYPVLTGKKARVRKTMYYAYRHLHRAARQGDYKLIEYNIEGERHTQLFNIKKDPFEMNNLALEDAYADKIMALRKIMYDMAEEQGDMTIWPEN